MKQSKGSLCHSLCTGSPTGLDASSLDYCSFSQPNLMIKRAIASASRQGITLVPGRPNPATGNCSFEAAIFNLNDRSCFTEKLKLSIMYYRRIWITDMENRLFESVYNTGYSMSEWHVNWQKLKEENIYEVDHFGDLVLPAIACGMKKYLLIFNTNVNNPSEPIYIINPVQYGAKPDSTIPIVLAYDLSHYESLHPANVIDIAETINLVNVYAEGRYMLTYRDLENLVSLDKPIKKRSMTKDEQDEQQVDEKAHAKDIYNEILIPSKETKFDTKKRKFNEMKDAEKKEYFTNLCKERRKQKKSQFLEKEENQWKVKEGKRKVNKSFHKDKMQPKWKHMTECLKISNRFFILRDEPTFDTIDEEHLTAEPSN